MSEQALAEVDPDDLEELLDRIELGSLVFNELNALRTSPESPRRVSVDVDSGVAPGNDTADFKMGVRCTFMTNDDEQLAVVYASALAHYTIGAGRPIPEITLHAFWNESAAETMWPYLRQAVNDLAARIGLAGMTLGVWRSGGQITVALDIPSAA